jgi:hypothetical protein
MQSNPLDDQFLRRYLLGELPERETDRLERRLLEDDDLFDLCEALETDLLAACDRDELPSAQRERVLRRLACSPRGRERLALARSLNAAADEGAEAAPVTAPVVPIFRRTAAPQQPWTRWAALAAAALLAVVGLCWFSWQQLQQAGTGRRTAHGISVPAIRSRPAAPQRPAPPAAETPAARDRTRPDRLAQNAEPVVPAPPQRPEPIKEVLFLSLMTTRGEAGLETLRIPSGTQVVEIQIDVEGLEDRGPFHTVVRDQENDVVSDLGSLEPRRLDWTVGLVFELQTEQLPTGRYKVAVTTRAGEELIQELEVMRENR